MPDQELDHCWAGRRSFFGGRWTEPCPAHGRHLIGNPGGDPIRLCDVHYRQIEEAGLVVEPEISVEEFDRRELRRLEGLDPNAAD